MENIDDLWNATLKSIEDKISKPSFDTWLKNTKAESLDNNTLTVSAPNEFARDWLEGRYTKLIDEILLELTGAELSTRFIIPDAQEPEDDISQTPKKLQQQTTPIQEKQQNNAEFKVHL